MGTSNSYKVIVIGGGPAGVTAALYARELGTTVALVERGSLGGTCTNDGCVPTRVLAKAARLIRDAEQFADYGLVGERPQVDFARLLARTQQVVYQIHEKKQLLAHLDQAGVDVFGNAGEARFLDPHTITLADGTTLSGEKFILCVGGHARRLPFPGSEHALTHSDVWLLKRLPASVAIVGAAATGCQLASVFSAFGAQVSLLELAPRLLPNEDELVSQSITGAFRQRGLEIITGIGGVSSIVPRPAGLQLNYTLDNEPASLNVEAIVLAVGWPGNIETLNLTAAGVKTERGYVGVDDTLQTSVPHIFAAGDITGRMMLVQSAGYEARVAAENAVLGLGRACTHPIVPHGGFTDPEYGSVGLTEQQARALENDCLVAVVPYADLDRAVIDGYPDGFCKLIVSRVSHQILGMHAVGEQAVEIVQIGAAGMAAGTRVEQLAELELAYPTFTTIVGLAARQIVRELEGVAPAPQWRTLKPLHPRAVEWEQTHG
ncbi:MAG: NAD(P)/FAD-dependent oxidoreductase [Anaerolineales bacterium]|nr:NAD(P)/FAD-dependent oxidoreductase [Anaerolineales bacterium]